VPVPVGVEPAGKGQHLRRLMSQRDAEHAQVGEEGSLGAGYLQSDLAVVHVAILSPSLTR